MACHVLAGTHVQVFDVRAATMLNGELRSSLDLATVSPDPHWLFGMLA